MLNIWWYVALAFIGILGAAYAIYSNRDTYKVSTLLIFYFFTASFTWLGEFTALGLFNSYAYKTGIFSDPWAQNLLGHLMLNTTIYPSAGVIMAAYSLRYGWMLLIATVFTLIEYLFIHLGLYEQHWWRYYMTFLTVIFFLLIYHNWFRRMNQKRYGITRTVTFYFVAMLIIHMPAPILLLLGKQHYQMSIVNSLVGNMYLSSIIIIFFYHMIEALLLVLFTCVLKKWYWSLIPMLISIAAQYIAAKMNLLVFENGWNLFYTLVIYELFIAIYIWVEKHTLKPNGHGYN